MNDLTIFNSNEFGEIRTVTIDGKPYFVAVDVATALGYATPRDAISRHCKGVVKCDTPTSSGVQQMSSPLHLLRTEIPLFLNRDLLYRRCLSAHTLLTFPLLFA